jgi:lysophospholipase L1-like esterase
MAVLGTALACSASAMAQAEAPVKTMRRAAVTAIDARWRDSFEGFAQADREHSPATGGVLFVGSSSIRLWDGLESQFGSDLQIVKRGFGGSRLSDVTQYLDRLVLPYKPRLIIVYAGDNDLAEGRSPTDVLHSFEAFVDGVHAELPDTRIAYVSIKPSPLREGTMAAARTTNQLIADYAASKPGRLSFIDIFSGMLGRDGHPRRELFRPDLLHLNATGYALWKAAIDPYLRHDTAWAGR